MGPRRSTLSTRELGRIRDPRRRLDAAVQVLDSLRAEQARVTRLRDDAIVRLCGQGLSYQLIADATGLTRGRVAQIVRRSRERPG